MNRVAKVFKAGNAVLDEVLSPSEAQLMQDLQTLDDPDVVQSLAEVLASPLPVGR